MPTQQGVSRTTVTLSLKMVVMQKPRVRGKKAVCGGSVTPVTKCAHLHPLETTQRLPGCHGQANQQEVARWL